MSDVRPLRGIRFDPDVVDFGGVLAPPYDVISDDQREQLYARDLRNVVRVDWGRDLHDDVRGVRDRYTRAAEHLQAWLRLGIVRQDERPSFYVTAHDFTVPGGGRRTRRGLFGRVRAAPWESSDLRPHERTLRGPKEDRLALLRATRTQTSAVFALWRDAPTVAAVLDDLTVRPPDANGGAEGELGEEHHRLWVVDDEAAVARLHASLSSSQLYVADGHHRYETAAAYAAERRREEPGAPEDADFELCLVHLCDADDPAIVLLPTHRLLLPRRGTAFSLDDLWMRLDDPWEVETAADLAAAVSAAAALREQRHAFAVAGRDGVAVLSRPRQPALSPRAGLDVVVLQDEVLRAAGVDEEAISSGALGYTREAAEVGRAVRAGEAVLGFCVNAATTAEVLAVADAGEVMPQKSTYFYPKVPTGLVLSPV